MEIRTIGWSAHAERRLAERASVSREMVEETVLQAEQRFPDPEHLERYVAHRRYVRSTGPLLVRVFYLDHGDGTAEIVSFYGTTQVRRYWRTNQ